MTQPVTSPKYSVHKPEEVDPLEYYKPAVQPSPPDERDYTHEEHSPFLAAAPMVQLPRSYTMPDTWGLLDQDGRGSCAAFQACGMARTSFARIGVKFDPSEEVQYALCREIENGLCQDPGSFPRDHMKVQAEIGIADEADAPYLSHDLCWVPDAALRAKMASRRITSYFVAGTIDAIKQNVYGTGNNDGFDVAACFVLYKNFFPDNNNNIPKPSGAVWGGHAMRIRGWDDDRVFPDGSRGGFYLKNQWSGWGDDMGCAWVSYAMCNLTEDKGGMWWGDTWVAVVNGNVNPQPNPNPDPNPNPTPDPTPDQYTAGFRAAMAAVEQISINIQAEIGAESAHAKGVARRDANQRLKGAQRLADAIGRDVHP